MQSVNDFTGHFLHLCMIFLSAFIIIYPVLFPSIHPSIHPSYLPSIIHPFMFYSPTHPSIPSPPSVPTNMIWSYPILSHHIRSYPILSHPIPSYMNKTKFQYFSYIQLWLFCSSVIFSFNSYKVSSNPVIPCKAFLRHFTLIWRDVKLDYTVWSHSAICYLLARTIFFHGTYERIHVQGL